MLLEDEIDITFNFSDTRLFHHVDIHTNNMFTKDVQVNCNLILIDLFLLYNVNNSDSNKIHILTAF